MTETEHMDYSREEEFISSYYLAMQ